MSPESAPDTSTPPVGVEDPAGGIPMRYDSERGMHIPGDNRGNIINFNPNISQSIGGEASASTTRSIPVVEAAPEEPQPLEPLAEEPEPAAAEQPIDQNAELLQRLDRMMELMQAQMEMQNRILEQNNRILEMLANQNRPAEPEPESAPEPEPEVVEPESAAETAEPEPEVELGPMVHDPANRVFVQPEVEIAPEPEPGVEDDLVSAPEDDVPDEHGNAAPGRARRMWAWMGDALHGRHLMNYVLARTISAEQQGTRRRRIFNRAAGALAMIGAGAGLYYLISRGMDGGNGVGQHLDTYNLEHGKGIVNVVLPKKFDLVTNINGVSSLIDVDSGNSVLTGSELPRGMFQSDGQLSRAAIEHLTDAGYDVSSMPKKIVTAKGLEALHNVSVVS